MVERPTLETRRLVLRPFTLLDAPAVKRLAGDRRVADTTLNIPHPYEDGMAEGWISGHQEAFERGDSMTWAIVRRQDEALIGAISLRFEEAHDRAEMGYWVGVPYWNKGYCTEAARAVAGYAFGQRGLNRLRATHLARNPASGRVMQKLGMTYEGTLRQQVKKRGVYEDLVCYGLLRAEWSQDAGSAQTTGA
jgi:ribosomal-protein-alanine N-acetyltransferase